MKMLSLPRRLERSSGTRESKILYVLPILAIVLVAGCIGQTAGGETIKIGLSAPLTGEAASFGEGALAGAELAIKEINDAGGINGKKLELIAEDDKCSNEGVKTFNKLVNADKVTAIIGPVCSAAAGPGVPIAEEGGVPTLIWGSAPHLTIGKAYIFRNYPSDAFQGKFAAEYAYSTLGKRKAAVIYVQNDWGQGIRDVFVPRFRELGGLVVFDEGITQDSRDLRTPISKAKEADPDFVYFVVYPANGVVGLKQLKELGLNVTVLAGDAFETDEVITSEGAEGTLYTLGKINAPEDFKARVENATGKKFNLVSPLAYDAINILANIMKEVGTDQKKIRDAPEDVSHEAVAFPLIEFDAEGDLKEVEFEVKLITGGKSVPYQG
jgi:branched-chain amino acid transport system substrate-binding protein